MRMKTNEAKGASARPTAACLSLSSSTHLSIPVRLCSKIRSKINYEERRQKKQKVSVNRKEKFFFRVHEERGGG